MRLDEYLIISNFVSSKKKAKNLIEKENIFINNKLCKKASYNIKLTDNINISKILNYPNGYYKLKFIQEINNIIKKNDIILDVGSSVGGFILYSLEILQGTGSITGIEYSKTFYNELYAIKSKHSNVEIFFENIFNIKDTRFKNCYYDIILFDLTIDPKVSINILLKLIIFLK